MKKTIIAMGATALLLSTSLSQAGGLAEPVMAMEPDEIIAAAPSSSDSSIIIPLILIALITAALSSSGSGGGAIVEAGGDELLLTSDMRAKTDIVPVGVADHGLPLYQFRYIGSPIVFEGVMAQDVRSVMPEAVVQRADGSLAVDYRMLGIDMKIVH